MQFELTHLLDALPGLGWTALPDGNAEFLNQRWLDYTGLTAQRAAGTGWLEAIHPQDRDGMSRYWLECAKAAQPCALEARLRSHDGTYRWFLFRANPVRDGAGNVSRWFGVNIDIEVRKQAEDALRSRERDLSLILNTIPTCIHVLGSDGSVFYVNQVTLDYTGLAADDIHKPDFRQRLFHPEDLERVHDERLAALRKPAPFELEIRTRRHDGVYRWFLNRYCPLLGDNGAIDRWYVAAFDIEDRKRAADELHSTQAALTHVTRVMMLGELTASIAHELNQPLAAILTNAGACLRTLANERPDLEFAQDTVRRTIRDATRAADVVTGLRALFSNKRAVAEPVNLSDAAREVIALCSSEVRRKGASLRPVLASDLPDVVGDRVQLQQVILNLLTNGADAMLSVDNRPRELSIQTLLDEDNCVRVTVRDNGEGFDPRNAEKLFTAFFTTKSQGMGIGLSVSRSIVENHRGRIWATANDGPGATFSFSIPRSR